MKRVSDVKDYIINTYPMHPNKFEVIKVGSAIWIYAIDKKMQLSRYQIFRGTLDTTGSSKALKSFLLDNIFESILALGYIPTDYHINRF